MREMIALKSFAYSTRRLRPGEDFIVKTERDARILKALGKAKPKRQPAAVPAMPDATARKVAMMIAPTAPTDPSHPTGLSQAPADDLSRLRTEYADLVGRRPFHGWDAVELQRRIDEALAS